MASLWNRRALALLLPSGFIALLFLTIGRIGFQPTDDGNLLAQTYRLLHGQIPHRDVIFARPMGSTLLHLVDYGLPLPLFESARLIGIAEIVAYSLLFGWLIFDASPARWGPARWLAASASALVNMHTFLAISWYTIDGLLFVALGSVLLRAGLRDERPWVRRAGLLALGFAPLAKQSFYLAPLLGLAAVAWQGRSHSAARRLRTVLGSGALLALPLLSYVTWLAAENGFRDFVDQVTGAKGAWGTAFVTAFVPGKRGDLFVLVASVAGLLVAQRFFSARARRGTAPNRWIVADLACRSVMTLSVVRFVVTHHLEFRATWGLALVWAALVVVLWRAIADRTFDVVGALIVATGWMTALSWGYAVPNFVAGTAALYLLGRFWQGARPPISPAPRTIVIVAGTALALLATLSVTTVFAQARYRHPYGDRPAAELTATLAHVSPEFGRIRTNPNTDRYMSQLASCIRRYPARWKAVLPDNPAIYPALRLRNPFPLDWLYFDEVAGHEDRLLAAARKLNLEGHYLVLFQTFKLTALQVTDPLPIATASSAVYGGRLIGQIRARLHGRPIVCGYFVGVYEPSAA
jgi:hypothetical protein